MLSGLTLRPTSMDEPCRIQGPAEPAEHPALLVCTSTSPTGCCRTMLPVPQVSGEGVILDWTVISTRVGLVCTSRETSLSVKAQPQTLPYLTVKRLLSRIAVCLCCTDFNHASIRYVLLVPHAEPRTLPLCLC